MSTIGRRAPPTTGSKLDLIGVSELGECFANNLAISGPVFATLNTADPQSLVPIPMKRASSKPPLSRAAISLTLSALALGSATAQSSDPGQTLPEGAVALPQGHAPTGLAKPVPSPLELHSLKGRSLKTSLTSAQVAELVPGAVLSMDNAVAIALSTNRDYASAVANLDRARGVKNEIKSGLNPQAGLGATIQEYDQDTTINFVGQSILQINQFNPVYAAQVTLPLDLLGSIHSAISQAQFNEVAARIDVNRARNNLVFAVRSAFYQALRAKAQSDVATENVQNAKLRLSDAQKGFSAGLASRFDVITAQRDVADAQQAEVNALAQVTLALGQLKSAVGIDISVPIKISDEAAIEMPPGLKPVKLDGPGPTHVVSASSVAGTSAPQTDSTKASGPKIVGNMADLGPEFPTLVSEATKSRPEVLESDAQITAAQKGITYAKRTLLPSFGLQLQYVYQPDASVFVRAHQASATFSVNVPLYDGGFAAARRQEANAVLSSAENAKRSAVDMVTLEVQQACVMLDEARDRVFVSEAEVAQAEEAYRLARVRNQAGVSSTPTVSPQLELSNAEAGLTAARSNRLNALYDYNVARTQLDRAVGRYSYGQAPGFLTTPTAKQTGQLNK